MHRRFLLLAAPLLAACMSENAPKQAATTPPPAAPAATKTVVVEVWHDTICPWCRIGLHNLGTAIRETPGVTVQVVHHPFLLDPTTPKEGRDLRAHLEGKYGIPADGMFDRVSAFGARDGLQWAWDQVRIGPNTEASHALIDWAPDASKVAVVAALHDTYFMHGRNLGDPDVLVAAAVAAGLDGEAARAAIADPVRLAKVRAAALAASNEGISGVPHYVIGGRTLQGAQRPDALKSALLAAAR